MNHDGVSYIEYLDLIEENTIDLEVLYTDRKKTQFSTNLPNYWNQLQVDKNQVYLCTF